MVMSDGAVRMLSAEAASPSKLFNASVEANESEREVCTAFPCWAESTTMSTVTRTLAASTETKMLLLGCPVF